MHFIKFSLFALILFQSNLRAETKFSIKNCLDVNFKLNLVHKGSFFGLLNKELRINKLGCNIDIIHKKYFSKEWNIDVCREPVHIKVNSTGGVDVAKKTSECIQPDKSRDTSNFCSQYFEIIDNVQDDGLIFASGDRDTLDTDHGKTYCAYLLLKKYLNDSHIFSKYTEDHILERDADEQPALEVIQENDLKSTDND